MLGPEVELRRIDFDLEAAAERIRATPYPPAQDEARKVLQPLSEAEMLAVLSQAELH